MTCVNVIMDILKSILITLSPSASMVEFISYIDKFICFHLFASRKKIKLSTVTHV